MVNGRLEEPREASGGDAGGVRRGGPLVPMLLKLFLSVALLVVLFLETDLGQLQRTLIRAHPGWLLLALLGFELSQALSAVRWRVLARPLGFGEPFTRFLTCYFSGMYLNLFAPSTVAGDIGRALFLAGGRGRRALALSTVVADRALGFVALVWIGAMAVLLMRGFPIPPLLHLAALAIPPLSVAAWWWGPLLAARMFQPGSRWRVLFERDLAPYRKDSRLLFASFALATVFHLLQIGTQVLVAWAVGLDVPWTYFLVFVPVVNILGMLPISLSGIGIREGGYWYFLSLMGVGDESSIALGLLSSAIVLVTGLTGAPVFMFLTSRTPLVESPPAA